MEDHLYESEKELKLEKEELEKEIERLNLDRRERIKGINRIYRREKEKLLNGFNRRKNA